MQNKVLNSLVTSIQAAEILRSGGVVAIPTETVYGLAGAISSKSALEKIFQIKERPFFDPLIVHVASIEQAKQLVSSWTVAADVLARKFWPGPLTLVVKKNSSVDDVITSGLETVGLRMPRHPEALAVINKLGEPVAAPSANKFGKTSPTLASHVMEEFAGAVPVVEGGPCELGIESTIIKIEELKSFVQITVLRKGSILPSELDATLRLEGIVAQFSQPKKNIEAPGQVEHHYMPKIPIAIVEGNLAGEALRVELQNKFSLYPKSIGELVLSHSPALAARELYAKMRELGSDQYDLLVFNKLAIHESEAWEALLDRLSRAATYK